MKNKIILIALVFLFISTKNFAQEIKSTGMCKPQLDTVMLKEVKIEDAIKWSENIPIKVGCEDGKVYILHSYDFTFLTLNPFQNREYGIGDDKGIPLLAQNALKKSKPGDTVILKNVTYLDENAKEKKLPVISFQLK